MAEPSLHATNWSNPQECPFCETGLADGGAGFIDHIETSRICKAGFDLWCERIRGDVSSEWGG